MYIMLGKGSSVSYGDTGLHGINAIWFIAKPITQTCKHSLSKIPPDPPKNMVTFQASCRAGDCYLHRKNIHHSTGWQSILFSSLMQVLHIHQLSLRDCASQFSDEDFRVIQVKVDFLDRHKNIPLEHISKLCLNEMWRKKGLSPTDIYRHGPRTFHGTTIACHYIGMRTGLIHPVYRDNLYTSRNYNILFLFCLLVWVWLYEQLHKHNKLMLADVDAIFRVTCFKTLETS